MGAWSLAIKPANKNVQLEGHEQAQRVLESYFSVVPSPEVLQGLCVSVFVLCGVALFPEGRTRCLRQFRPFGSLCYFSTSLGLHLDVCFVCPKVIFTYINTQAGLQIPADTNI